MQCQGLQHGSLDPVFKINKQTNKHIYKYGMSEEGTVHWVLAFARMCTRENEKQPTGTHPFQCKCFINAEGASAVAKPFERL